MPVTVMERSADEVSTRVTAGCVAPRASRTSQSHVNCAKSTSRTYVKELMDAPGSDDACSRVRVPVSKSMASSVQPARKLLTVPSPAKTVTGMESAMVETLAYDPYAGVGEPMFDGSPRIISDPSDRRKLALP